MANNMEHDQEIEDQSSPIDSDDEGPIRPGARVSNNEETIESAAEESENEEPNKDTSSESESDPPKRSNHEEAIKSAAGDSDNEEPTKDTSSESESDQPSKSNHDETIRSAAEESDNEQPNKDTSSESESDQPSKSNQEEQEGEEPTRLGSSESESEEPNRSTKVYDFDIMMAKKKEENKRKRRRRNYDIINDNDDIIADIINQMKDAAEGDAEANRNKQAAIRKLKLLPFVMSQLKKIEMRDAFLDSDVLSVMTEWLAPLPDKSLPHLQVREAMLKTLMDMNLYDIDRIKNSGIGKAIMYLFKHPKETKENKQRAKHLISCWSRPIFQLDSSFNSISREEREQRDLELMNKQRRASRTSEDSPGDGPGPSNTKAKKFKDDNTSAQKPGDKGWIPRARVPAPSMRDYVIRPRSKVDGDVGKNSKRPSNMLEKYMKSQQERRRAGRQQRAINMSIDRG